MLSPTWTNSRTYPRWSTSGRRGHSSESSPTNLFTFSLVASRDLSSLPISSSCQQPKAQRLLNILRLLCGSSMRIQTRIPWRSTFPKLTSANGWRMGAFWKQWALSAEMTVTTWTFDQVWKRISQTLLLMSLDEVYEGTCWKLLLNYHQPNSKSCLLVLQRSPFIIIRVSVCFLNKKHFSVQRPGISFDVGDETGQCFLAWSGSNEGCNLLRFNNRITNRSDSAA